MEVYSTVERDGKTYYYARLYENIQEKMDEENHIHYSADCYVTPEMKSFKSKAEAEAYFKAHFDDELKIAKGAEKRDTLIQEREDAQSYLDAGDYVNSKAIEELLFTDITLEAWRNKYRTEYGKAWHMKREERRDVLNV